MVKVSLDHPSIDHMRGAGRALGHSRGSLSTASLTGGARSIRCRTIHMEVSLEDLLPGSGYRRATRTMFTSLYLPRGCRHSCEDHFSHHCVYRELFVSREAEFRLLKGTPERCHWRVPGVFRVLLPADLDFVQMAVLTCEIANIAVVGTVCKCLPKLLPLEGK